jgi:mono/diheme cytochrome c family protein
MIPFSSKKIFVLIALLFVVGALYKLALSNQKVDYNTHVKPIINKKCISCHGGVKQEAGFSLLFQEEALGLTESGKPAIIPGDPEGSELIKRITHKDPAERMPYKHEPLSEEEIEVFRQWIK